MDARGGLMIDLNQQDDASGAHEGGQTVPASMQAPESASLDSSATLAPHNSSGLESDTMKVAIAYRLRTHHVGAAANFAGEAGTPLKSGALVNCLCCGKVETRKRTLICDLCGQSFHLKCLKLRESHISTIDEWLCGTCMTVQGERNWLLGRINTKQESQLAMGVSNGVAFASQVAHEGPTGGMEIPVSPPQPSSNALDSKENSLIADSGISLSSSHKDFKRQRRGKDDATESNVTLSNRLPGINIVEEPRTRMTRLKTLCRAKEDVQISGKTDTVDSISVGEKNSSYASGSPLSKELDDDLEDFLKETYIERLVQEHLQKLKEFVSQQGGKLDGDWRVSVKKRAHPDKAFDVLYFSPDKQKFRSKLEVARYLGYYEHRKEDAPVRDSPSSAGRIRKRDVPQELQQSDEDLMKRRKLEPDNPLGLQEYVDNLENQLPLQCMDLTMEALGVVKLRPGYYNEHFVWPVGYRCSWHDGVTGSVCISEVIDGGSAPPIFRVTRRSCNVSDLCTNSKVKDSDKPSCQELQAKLETNRGRVYDEEDELNMLKGALTGFLDENISITAAGQDELWESNPVTNKNVCSGCKVVGIAYQSGEMFLNSESLTSATTPPLRKDEIGDIVVESSSSWGAWRLLAEEVVNRAATLYDKNLFQFGCKHADSSCLAASGFNVGNSLEGPSGRLLDPQPFFTKLREWLGQDRFGFNIPLIQKYLEAKKAKVEVPRAPPPSGWPIFEKISADYVGDLLQIWEFLCRFAEILGQKEAPSLEELEDIVADTPQKSVASTQTKACVSNTNKSTGRDGSLPQNGKNDRTVKPAGSMVQNQEVLGIKRVGKSKPFSSPGCCSAALAASNIALLKVALSDLQQMILGGSPDWTTEPKRGKKKEGEVAGSSKKQSSNLVPLNELTWPEVARRYVIGLLTLNTCGENLEISVHERQKILRCIQGDGGVLCGALDGVAAVEADALLLATAEKQLSRWLLGAEDKHASDGTARPRAESKSSLIAVSEGTSRKPAWAVVLEPVRKLATNVGARIRNCVREALEMNPPDWARETLEWSISKDVYKGNASGPTKRAVLSVLEKVTDENYVIPPKVEKKPQYKAAAPELVMKRCRIILRELVTSDDVRVFCNSLGGTVLGYFEKEDDNLDIPLPLVARPLDFRMIDSRLAACSYGDSHESYAADMRQLFQNIPTVFQDREDLIRIGQEMSQQFEVLYEEKIVKLVNGKEEIGGSKETNQKDVTDEKDVSTESQGKLFLTELDEDLKKAPWEEGVCKICGVDKDDDSTLLCDGCDAEYHIYCLEPPLSMIPEGNWYCPACTTLERDSSNSCPAVADPSRKILKQLDRSRLSEDGSILSALVKSMEGNDYWHLSGSERLQLLKFLCDKVLESNSIRDHIDQSIEALPELQQRLRVLMIERQAFVDKGSLRTDEVSASDDLAGPTFRLPQKRGRADDCKFDVPYMDASNSHPQSVAYSQNGNLQPQNLVRDNFVHSSPSIAMDSHTFHLNAPFTNFSHSPEPLVIDEQKVASQAPQVLKLENQSEKQLLVEAAHCADEFQATPGKTALEILEAEIEKVEGELMKMAPRRECLGRDELGRTYWALGWAGKFPWILAEKASGFGGHAGANACVQVDTVGGLEIQEWAGYNDSDCMEQLLRWLKPTVAAERFLKSALTKWCLLWSSKYKKEPDKQQMTKSKYVAPGSVNTKAFSLLSKTFGSISQSEGIPEEFSRKRGKKKKSSADGKIYRCDCLELVWATRIHCPLCHHTYDVAEELKGHNNGACSWRGFEDDSEALIMAKAKKAKNEVQDFQPLDLSLIIKQFTVHTSNQARVLEIGCLADKGPKFITAPSVSPLLDPSLHITATASLPSLLGRSASVGTLKDLQTGIDVAQSKDGSLRSKSNGSKDICMSNGGTSVDSSIHIDKESGARFDAQDKDVSGSNIHQETHVTYRCHSLNDRLPPSQPLLMANMWAFKKLKVSLLDMESLLSADVLEASRSEPCRRRAWRSFVKSAASILELVQSLTLLEQMVKANCLKESWCNWTTLSAGFGINTLCSLALRIFSLDAAIKYKRFSVDPDTDDSGKPHKTGRKKKTLIEV